MSCLLPMYPMHLKEYLVCIYSLISMLSTLLPAIAIQKERIFQTELVMQVIELDE